MTADMQSLRPIIGSAAVLLLAAGCGASGPQPAASSATSAPAAPATPAASSGSAGPAGQVLARIRVGDYPDGITAAFGSVWTANLNAASLPRIDPAARKVTATIAVPPGPISLLAADGAIWAADYNGTTVSRIDPASDRVTATIRVGAKPVSVLLAGGDLWVFNQGDKTISVVDPHTTKVRRTVRLAAAAGFAAHAGGLLWVPDFEGGSHEVLAVSARTGQVTRTVHAGSQPVNVSFGAGSGWAGNGPDDTVTRFDPATGAVQATIRTPADAGNVLAAGGAVWVT